MNDFSTLVKHQSDLLSTIFTINKIAVEAINTPATVINSTSSRGILAYQANASASAARSLLSAYPVIAQLIGEETFAHLARDFWTQHPPVRGDLAQWGGELAVFITSIQALQTEPYLSDVAQAEWALHTAAIAPDTAADLASFSLLTEQDPAAVTLVLAPGMTLIASIYPLASLLAAHLNADAAGSPSFEDVGQKLRKGTPEIALVWRQGLRPMVTYCAAVEANFICHLLAGKSLLAALELSSSIGSANESAPFDFNLWLPRAVQSGLLLGARLHPDGSFL